MIDTNKSNKSLTFLFKDTLDETTCAVGKVVPDFTAVSARDTNWSIITACTRVKNRLFVSTKSVGSDSRVWKICGFTCAFIPGRNRFRAGFPDVRKDSQIHRIEKSMLIRIILELFTVQLKDASSGFKSYEKTLYPRIRYKSHLLNYRGE